MKEYRIKNIKIYQFHNWHFGFIYFLGVHCGVKVFIKLCIGKYNTIYNEGYLLKYGEANWHPKIIAVTHSKYEMIVTEFIESRIVPNKIIAEDLKKLVEQAKVSLIEMKEIGMFHRDINPENIIITTQNKLLLFDFGWSVYKDYKAFGNEFIESILNIKYREKKDEFDDALSMYKSFCEMFPDVPTYLFDPIKVLIGTNVLKCE